MATALRYGPIAADAVHICVDMQVLFASGSPWQVPWFEKTLPNIREIAMAHAAATIFTVSCHRNDPLIRAGRGVHTTSGGVA